MTISNAVYSALWLQEEKEGAQVVGREMGWWRTDVEARRLWGSGLGSFLSFPGRLGLSIRELRLGGMGRGRRKQQWGHWELLDFGGPPGLEGNMLKGHGVTEAVSEQLPSGGHEWVLVMGPCLLLVGLWCQTLLGSVLCVILPKWKCGSWWPWQHVTMVAGSWEDIPRTKVDPGPTFSGENESTGRTLGAHLIYLYVHTLMYTHTYTCTHTLAHV